MASAVQPGCFPLAVSSFLFLACACLRLKFEANFSSEGAGSWEFDFGVSVFIIFLIWCLIQIGRWQLAVGNSQFVGIRAHSYDYAAFCFCACCSQIAIAVIAHRHCHVPRAACSVAESNKKCQMLRDIVIKKKKNCAWGHMVMAGVSCIREAKPAYKSI